MKVNKCLVSSIECICTCIYSLHSWKGRTLTTVESKNPDTNSDMSPVTNSDMKPDTNLGIHNNLFCNYDDEIVSIYLRNMHTSTFLTTRFGCSHFRGFSVWTNKNDWF